MIVCNNEALDSHSWGLISKRKTEINPEYDEDVLIVIYAKCVDCKLCIPIPVNDSFLNFIIRNHDFYIGMPPDFPLMLLKRTCDELIEVRNKSDETNNPCSGGS